MSGQPTYKEIRDADLAPLREAVAEWNRAPGTFQQIGVNFRTEVSKGLVGSTWEGEAADAAERAFRKVRKEVRAAEEEARRVHKVLREGLKEFTAARKALDDIEEELRGHRHLRLDKGDGSVHLELKGEEEKERAALTRTYRETVESYRRRTRAAVRRAADADRDLTRALTTDVNGEARGFNDTAYDSLDDARRQSEKDLRTALRIAALEPAELSAGKLAQLDAVFARHGLDPVFAERFATGLGPEKTLRLWYNATHPQGAYDPGWLKSAKNLQEHLGETLATATQSNSAAMREWKNEVIRLGPERLETDGATARPYGFQLTSNLMRFGTWDADFLNRYGDRLVAFDRKHNTEEGFAYWSNNAGGDFFNLHGRKDDGQDPMTGFLEGLGHNPEAAGEFFGQPEGVKGIVDKDSELNDHLKYLATERNWIFDGYEGDPRRLPGHEALGHALVSATTGYAWDDEAFRGKDPEIFESGGDRRTAETAGVMEQVVHIYGNTEGNGPELLHEQPGMAVSLGTMGGAYVDDINHNLSGLGETSAKDTESFPGQYTGRADFGRYNAIGFLSLLGQNEESYKIMTQAEHIYTLSRLDGSPPTSSENTSIGERVLKIEAEARGTLDHSRAQQAETTYGEGTKEANDSIARSTEWKKTMGGTLIGTGVGIALIPLTGAAGGALVAPIAAEAGSELMKQFLSQEITRAADEETATEKTYAARNDIFQGSETDLGNTLESYLEGHNVSDERRESIKDSIKSNYLAVGPQGNAYEGHAPYQKD